MFKAAAHAKRAVQTTKFWWVFLAVVVLCVLNLLQYTKNTAHGKGYVAVLPKITSRRAQMAADSDDADHAARIKTVESQHASSANTPAEAPQRSIAGKRADELLEASEPPPSQRDDRVPRVALMFLVRDNIPTEPLWHDWFREAGLYSIDYPLQAGRITKDVALHEALGRPLLPTSSYFEVFDKQTCWNPNLARETHAMLKRLRSTAADDATAQHTHYYMDGSSTRVESSDYMPSAAQPRWAPDANAGHEIYLNQSLFRVYVHPQKESNGYAADSVFHQRELSRDARVATTYASHSLLLAERRLLAAALQDEDNVKFVLISEACVPLYHPAVMYAQLIMEQQSRVILEPHGNTWEGSPDRQPEALESEHFNSTLWRKSWQWKTLTRTHARLIVADTHLEPLFAMFCRKLPNCPEIQRIELLCITDEHYVASLLALYSQQDSCLTTDTTHAAWITPGSTHPHTYLPRETNAELLERLRVDGHPDECSGTASVADAVMSRMQAFKAAANATAAQLVWDNYKPLNSRCTLFARKFSQRSSRVFHRLACSGKDGLQLQCPS